MDTKGGERDDHCASGLQVRVTTITGSITGTTISLTVDGSLSVHDFKLLVQDKADTPLEQRGPSTETIMGVSPDFQRVFFDGSELADDDSSLDACGVKEDSALSFAVGKALGKKLRNVMGSIEEDFDFSEHGDCGILASVLKNLARRILGRNHSTRLTDALFRNVFDKKFRKFKGVDSCFLTLENAEGGQNDYIQWVVFEEDEDSSLLTGGGHPHPLTVQMQNHEEVGAPGYFGPTGQRMACTSHFTKRVGTHVSRTGVTVGRTAVSKRADDFAVVDISALAQSTGLITTNSPNVGDPTSRVATFQTGAIKKAIIQYVDEDKFIAKEPLPATSKQGDSNTPWSTPTGRTVGIHKSGDPEDGSMSVFRLDSSPRRRAVQLTVRRLDSGSGKPQGKKQKTGTAVNLSPKKQRSQTKLPEDERSQ